MEWKVIGMFLLGGWIDHMYYFIFLGIDLIILMRMWK